MKDGQTVDLEEFESYTDEDKKKALDKLLMEVESLNEIEDHVNTPNIFNILSVSSTEIRHSNFLAWLLNPTANHGLGGQFLRRYLMKVVVEYYKDNKPMELYQIDSMDLSDVQVFREKDNIDVIVDFGQKNELVMVIENKIRSKQGKKQLEGYRNSIENNSRYSGWKHIFLFLTMEDEPPLDDGWIDARYDVIREILEEFKKAERFDPRVEQYVDDYLWILKNDLMTDELQEICDKIYSQHRLAIDTINEYKTDDRYTVFQYIMGELKRIDDEGIHDIIPLKSIKSYIRFTTPAIRGIEGNNLGDHTWLKEDEDDIFAFEISNPQGNDARISLIIGPGNQNARMKWFEVCRTNRKLFESAASKKKGATERFTRVYSKHFRTYSDIEKTKKAYAVAIDELIKKDLNEIETFLRNSHIDLS